MSLKLVERPEGYYEIEPRPTPDELAAVFSNAGLDRSTTHTVGWGTEVHELVRPLPS